AIALHSGFYGLPVLYAAAFVIGVTRGFAEPAAFALETQIVPRSLFVAAATVQASVWQACAIAGPALGGAALLLGRAAAYALIAALFAASSVAVWSMQAPPVPRADESESILRSIALGVRYVFGNQVLVGSMALDLFAVLFGGAIALLPVFAKEILKVGP